MVLRRINGDDQRSGQQVNRTCTELFPTSEEPMIFEAAFDFQNQRAELELNSKAEKEERGCSQKEPQFLKKSREPL